MREMAQYEFNRSDYDRVGSSKARDAQQGFWNLWNEKVDSRIRFANRYALNWRGLSLG